MRKNRNIPIDPNNFNETHQIINSDTNVILTNRQKFNHIFGGACSGAITRIIIQPLDVLKIRFQIQIKSKNDPFILYKYKNLTQAIKLIYHQEGIKALWKGHAPGQLLSIVFGITQFYTFENLQIITKEIPLLNNRPNLRHYICGSISAAIASCITAPIDTIKTRLIAQDEKGYKNAKDGFIKIIKNEGPIGLYRGLSSGLYQIVPFMGWNFMFYSLFGEIALNLMEIDKDRHELPVWCLLLNGGISGVLSKTLVYPFDLIQMRLQIQGYKELQRDKNGYKFKCKNVWNCLLLVIRTEGYRNLFQGITPTLIKACLSSALHFSVYDKILNILTKL